MKRWRLSIVLNKHPYSYCANPHIAIYREGGPHFGIKFPAHWRIWNIELDRVKRRASRESRRHLSLRRNGIRSVCKLHKTFWFRGHIYAIGVHLFEVDHPTNAWRLYVSMPWKTWVVEKRRATIKSRPTE